MSKILFTSLALGFLLLLIPTLYLIAWNWSPKIISVVLTILLGGTVTSLIAVLAILKETQKEDAFVTSVLYDVQSHWPVMVTGNPRLPSIRRHQRLFSLSRPTSGEGKNTRLLVSPPETVDEKFHYGQELLLYTIFHELPLLYSSGSVMVVADGEFPKPEVFAPPPSIPTIKLKGKSFFKHAKTNRFAGGLSERIWDEVEFTFPDGVQARLETTEEKDPSKRHHSIIIEKPLFFTVVISPQPLGGAGPSKPPPEMSIMSQSPEKCVPYFFRLDMKATFYKFTAGNSRTDDYKAWVDWLFRKIKTDFSDETR
jgi:hypothetical protein